jgi:hypothetical protein
MPQTAAQRAWYERNRERAIAKAVARQTANHADYLAYQKAHRAKNLDGARANSRAWKVANGERHRASSRDYSRRHRAEISEKRKGDRRTLKSKVLDAYGGRCACCGEQTYEFLTIDHVHGDGASHRRALGIDNGRSHKLYRHLVAAGFPSGFRVLCFNCNSARGFYGYCPHQPHDRTGVPPTRVTAQCEPLMISTV